MLFRSFNSGTISPQDTISPNGSVSPFIKVPARIKISDVAYFKSSGKVEEDISLQSVEESPERFILEQNYPNPFNPVTVIRYSLFEEGNVTLKIYDVLGREVAILLNNETQEEGEHEIMFDASKLSSGMYFYKISTNNFSSVKKMLLMK